MHRRNFLRAGVTGITGAALSGVVLAGCDSFLEPEVHSQLPSEFAEGTAEGIRSTLNSAYASFNYTGYSPVHGLQMEEWTTDTEWETAGGENIVARQLIGFTWNATTPWFNRDFWPVGYNGIRDANIVLENLEGVEDLSTEEKDAIRAEARLIRAVSYIRLYEWFGPVPLRTTTNPEEQPLEIPRATEEGMQQFIETELLAALADLPAPAEQPVYGRVHTGAARGHLCKFYLNTKQWQKAADMAQEIIDMGYYELYPGFIDLFKVENQPNRELIWAHQSVVQAPGCTYQNGAFPPGFQSDPVTGAFFADGMNNWAAQYRVNDAFYDSFEEGDARRTPLMAEYVNAEGVLVSLRDLPNNIRSLKLFPDPDAVGNEHGNDIPDIRYADILLSRAEALNELQGPNQESVDLVNQVRARAGLEGVSLSAFGSAEALRNHIVVKERGWEFYTERKRRQDLIRIGMFIEGTFDGYAVGAQDRGITNAQEHHQRFPIPQPAMDANSELEQNPGYSSAA